MFRKAKLGGAAALIGLMLAGWAVAQAPAAPAVPTAAGFSAQVSAESAYNSNLLDNNQFPVAGTEQVLNGALTFAQLSPSGSFSLAYQPSALLFPSGAQAANIFNQIATLGVVRQLAPRWTFTAQSGVGYLQQTPVSVLTGNSTALASQVLTVAPGARELTGQAQLGLAYSLGPRSSLALTGGYTESRYPDAAASGLSSIDGASTDLVYVYQLSARTRLGLDYHFENDSVGSTSHLAADSLTPSWTYALTPFTSLQLYAGPEYSQVHDVWALALPGGSGSSSTLVAYIYRVRTEPRFGGALTHQATALSWSLQAHSEISNGGGALPFPVTLRDASLTLSPQAPWGWHIQFGLHVSQLTAVTSSALAAQMSLAAAGLVLTRPLNRHLGLRLECNGLDQRGSSALLPLPPDVTQTLAGAGLAWSWPASAAPGEH